MGGTTGAPDSANGACACAGKLTPALPSPGRGLSACKAAAALPCVALLLGSADRPAWASGGPCAAGASAAEGRGFGSLVTPGLAQKPSLMSTAEGYTYVAQRHRQGRLGG